MSLVEGVDVASFQGKPAQWQAAAGGIGWAAVKLTELSPAGYVNPDAAADWAWLKQAGKARVGYLFGHPNVSASATVAYFIAELARLGLGDDDAVAVDIEVSNGRSPSQVASWTAAVAASLRAHLDRIPLIYTYPSFAEAGNCAGLGGYPLWISDPNHPAGHPAVPAPWKTWAVHQYKTAGDIDRDVLAYPTVAAMTAALGKHQKETPAVTEWNCKGERNLHQIAEANDTEASTILRLTANTDGHYAGNVAAWLNEVFAGQRPATDPVPDKCVLKVPARTQKG